jgi:hypothetical protein
MISNINGLRAGKMQDKGVIREWGLGFFLLFRRFFFESVELVFYAILWQYLVSGNSINFKKPAIK